MDETLFLNDPGAILREVLVELERAKAKHPRWPKHIVARAAIVSEESGELIREAIQSKYERKGKTRAEFKAAMRKEAIQVAATAIRFIKNL